jgi:aerobic C4-dicarboxylate transport protein
MTYVSKKGVKRRISAHRVRATQAAHRRRASCAREGRLDGSRGTVRSVATKNPSRRLYAQVLVAIAVGIAIGHFFPHLGEKLKPLGDVFVRLVKMVIAPVIFTTVVVAIAGQGDVKRAGRVGGKAIVYFEAVSTLALVLGLVVVNVLRPGDGIHASVATLDVKAVESYATAAKSHGLLDTITELVPLNIVDAIARGDILQILVFSIPFGIALGRMRERGRPLVELLDHASHALFGVVAIVMHFAPLGALGAMAFTVAKYHVGSLLSLGKLMGCFYLTCILFVLVVLGAIARLGGASIVAILRYFREELAIVLGTSSSESVLPRMIEKLTGLGCDKSVVELVVPTGYSFNLDGTSIYLTMAIGFLAQATDTQLSLGKQLAVLGVLLLTSKGAAGVTGSGFITLAATLSTTNALPVASLALILGIDRFMSEARALTNLVGNGVATIVVARWEGALDVAKMKRVLARGAMETPGEEALEAWNGRTTATTLEEESRS